jgi:hypothetical protein
VRFAAFIPFTSRLGFSFARACQLGVPGLLVLQADTDGRPLALCAACPRNCGRLEPVPAKGILFLRGPPSASAYAYPLGHAGLRELADLSAVTQAIISAERSFTFLRSAGLSFRMISRFGRLIFAR